MQRLDLNCCGKQQEGSWFLQSQNEDVDSVLHAQKEDQMDKVSMF